jgi:hypothetical protein
MATNSNILSKFTDLSNLGRIIYFTLFCVFFYLFYKAIKLIILKMKNILGLETVADSSEKNLTGIIDDIKSQSGVKNAINAEVRQKAEKLYNAMEGWGTDVKTIFGVFNSIRSVNEMKAIFVVYDVRKIWNAPFWTTTNLEGALRAELSDEDYLQVNKWLILIK